MTRRRKPEHKPRSDLQIVRYGLAAAVTGCMWFLATANFDVWPLGWVASVPLLFAAEKAKTNRRAFLFGWIAGTVTNIGGFYWIANLLTRFAHLPLSVALFALLLMGAYQGLTQGLFAYVVRRMRQEHDLPMALVAPLAMVTFELIMPLLFPCYLAICQAWQLHVIQIADLTGPLGVTALLFMINGAIYDVATVRRWHAAGIAGGVLLLALAYGELRIRQQDARVAAAPHVTVGLVQGNIPFSEKGFEHPELAAQQLADLKDRSVKLERAGAELIVWSETALPYMMPRDLKREPERPGIRSDNGQPRFKAPLLFGAMTYDVDAKGAPVDRDPYNSAVMMDPAGNFTGTFDKMFLVMFSEHIPLVETFPVLRRILPANSGNLTPGTEAKIFTFRARDGREVRIAPLICFEDIISKFSRVLGDQRPQILVNITNDAWFGNTSEPWEHLALSVFRSVELRAPMVRAVNTGVSAFIDPAGRVGSRTNPVDPLEDSRPAETLIDDVPVLDGGGTVYSTVGDVFGYGCLLATLWLWQVGPRLRRRKAAAK